MTLEAIGFGHAKIILLGEHSVVYGQPALAAALDRGFHASARLDARDGGLDASGPQVHIPEWSVTVTPSAEGDDLSRALHRLFEWAPAAAKNATVVVQPEVPSRAGLGSSAALSVAVIRALAKLGGEVLEASEVEQIAGLAEEVFHGRASGIDAAVASRAGVLRFQRGEPAERVRCAPIPVVVAQVERRVPTREMVARVAHSLEERPADVKPLLDDIGRLVESARVALEAGEINALGDAMNENHELLRALDVSSSGLDGACQIARDAGALGAKLTGAGGGGCMIALASGCEQAVATVLAKRAMWVQVAQIGGD